MTNRLANKNEQDDSEARKIVSLQSNRDLRTRAATKQDSDRREPLRKLLNIGDLIGFAAPIGGRMSWFPGLAAALLISATCAYAETGWGNIGGGWKTLGGEQTEDPEPQDASLTTPAVTRASGPVMDTATLPRSENRTLVRSIAQKFADHGTLRRAGIDPREFVIFFESMIEVESRFNDRAISTAGAIGLAQLMPGTARYLRVDPHDRRQNVEGGARYLIEQIDEFGTLSLAVAAYNAGPEAVRKHQGVPPYRETERHVARVLSIYERRWRTSSRSD